MPPALLAVAEQLHWPFSSEQVAGQPRTSNWPPILEHSTLTDETVRHCVVNGNVMEPVVVVLSSYVPLALAVHVPVTFMVPTIGTDGQPIPRSDASMLPDRLRHADVTFQVPTTSPPQDDPLGQSAGALVLPELPPLPVPPPPEPPQPLVDIVVTIATVITSPKSTFRMETSREILHTGTFLSRNLASR